MKTLINGLHKSWVVNISAAGFLELGGDEGEIVFGQIQVEEVQYPAKLQLGHYSGVGGRPVEVLEVGVDQNASLTHLFL